jgi:ABC-type molybdate transport system substrate-binding protein
MAPTSPHSSYRQTFPLIPAWRGALHFLNDLVKSADFRSHDPIIYPVAATVNAKSETIQYLALLRSAAAKSIFEGYGFSVLAKPTS